MEVGRFLYSSLSKSLKYELALAESYGFDEYATPAGGCCFLTDKQYSDKLVDLWRGRGSRAYDFDDIMLLKIGRHLRPKENFQLIISREEGEGHHAVPRPVGGMGRRDHVGT